LRAQAKGQYRSDRRPAAEFFRETSPEQLERIVTRFGPEMALHGYPKHPSPEGIQPTMDP